MQKLGTLERRSENERRTRTRTVNGSGRERGERIRGMGLLLGWPS